MKRNISPCVGRGQWLRKKYLGPHNACEGGGAIPGDYIDYTYRYIYQQTEKIRNNPRQLGAGGTPFMTYLAKDFEDTNQIIQ